MGVPKFFRWISERYPKINQAIHAPPNPETQKEYFPSTTPVSVNTDNTNTGTSTGKDTGTGTDKGSKQDSKMYMLKNSITSEFDRLYLDMNGIIHCCSHNNAGDDTATPDPDTNIETEGIPSSLQGHDNNTMNTTDAPGTVQITEEDIFRNVCYYIDRVVTDIVKPNELVYMAIDGVAPRAKMNQQRSRRYRSGKEKEIEKTFYAASLLKQSKELEELQQFEQQQQEIDHHSRSSGNNLEDFNYVNMDGEYEYNHENVTRNSTMSGNSSSTSKADEFNNDDFTTAGDVKEVEPGRFTGKFETSGKETDESSSLDSGMSTLSTSSTNRDGSSSNSTSAELFDKDYDDFIKSMESLKGGNDNDDDEISSSFHSNSITPGTPFFERCTAHLQEFIKQKLHSDPRWAHLTIIFSGPRTPGEGEHKIMDFIRNQKQRKDYNPNTRHCLFGQDGDLIMLGLATHEPHFALLREEVIFDQKRKERNLDLLKAAKLKSLEEAAALAASLDDGSGMNDQDVPISNEALSVSIDSYIHNSNFELLHMSILRDYLAYEFETKDVLPTSPFELEKTIDDFVFMTFFVGNDFLPHMPAIDIADEAFDLLFYVYKRNRWKWLKGGREKMKPYPYLTRSGDIVSGRRLEMFLSYLGKHEDPYYDNKQRTFADENERARKADKKAGRDSLIPTDEILAAKEEWERTEYKEMLKSIAIQKQELTANSKKFTPVASERGIFDELESNQNSNNKGFEFKPESSGEEELEAGFLSRMGTLFRYSLSNNGDETENTGSKADLPSQDVDAFDDHAQDLKARYYFDKFKFSPLDAERHIALRKAYIEGLVWNLQYYYKGCASWDWYYPFHYGPMLSDLKNIDNLLKQISFKEDTSEPLLPFEQLMANLPPSSAELLPNPYQWLMKSTKSPILDFYPESFTVDMNGKRWPWEAVVLLPFIDSDRLVHASRSLVKSEQLTDRERSRNCVEDGIVYTRNEMISKDMSSLQNSVSEQSSSLTEWKHSSKGNDSVFHPELLPGTIVPYPGFPTLKDAPVQALKKRKVGINVFGRRSRYKTAVLEMNNDIPMIASAAALADKFIGTTLHFRYPFLQEGFVTALSDAEMTVRGKEAPRRWNPKEAQTWKLKNDTIQRQYATGQGITGTGGWDIPESSVSVSIRPFKEFQTLPDGRKVKVYARLEVEVPFIAALWSPSQPDPRFSNVPVRIEKNPYRFGSEPVSQSIGIQSLSKSMKGKKSKRKKSNGNFFSSKKGLPPNKSALAGNNILPPSQPNALQKNLGSTKGYCTWPIQGYQRTTTATDASLLQKSRPMKIPSMRSRSIGVVAVAAAALFSKGVNSQLFSSSSLSHKYYHHNILIPRGGALEWENTVFNENEGKSESGAAPPLEFAHGTTTLSFTFDGGIVAAVDSRASIGNFVGSKTTQKVLPITDHILGTMAGGAADCSFWIRRLQAESRYYELSEGKAISVARVSRVLADYLYENRGFDLSVGTMIMGFDEYGPSIYYVDNSGSRLKGDLFSVGSGSTFALGVLDTERRQDMKEEEAVALGIKAIRHATFRDAFSGGYIGVYVIKESGWKKVFSEDLALVDQK